MNCSLCESKGLVFFLEKKGLRYHQCSECELIQLDSESILTEAQEKKTYERHKNSSLDPRYREFLSQLFLPLRERVKTSSYGLDFGCGPGPTLSVMFEECGHQMEVYDKYFFENESVYSKHYDFITATEVFEHLISPKDSLEKLFKCLKNEGYLGVMTSLYDPSINFKNWYYRNDPTHIRFYTEKTFQWIADKFNCSLEILGQRVCILKKP